MALLETVGLGKDYGKTAAVVGLDLAIEEGEIFGLLGPNGAGKTTAISMMCGVLTPSRGTAVIDGHDIRAEPFAARRKLGLAPQELALYEELSARENLRFFGSTYGLSGAALADQVDWALGVAGLSDRATEPVVRFSGGMKRRLNLAAGMLHRPRLLVLDEPTVGVDPQSRNYLLETIRELNREHGVTVIYTSHYIEEVQALCRRVGIIDGGELCALDTVERLVGDQGDGALEIEFRGDAAAVAEALRPLGEAVIEGQVVRVVAGSRLTPVVKAVEDSGAEIRALRTLDADLEAVFLRLTGKSLRDG